MTAVHTRIEGDVVVAFVASNAHLEARGHDAVTAFRRLAEILAELLLLAKQKPTETPPWEGLPFTIDEKVSAGDHKEGAPPEAPDALTDAPDAPPEASQR
jgi:hypothetical protein